MLRSLASILTFFVCALSFAQQPSETQRLLDIGKLWVTVKYFHPYLAYRSDIDWDKALIDALPKIRIAATPEEYVAAVNAMLDTLHDPLTRAAVSGAEEKGSDTEERANGQQRSRMYHGLPPYKGNSPFYYSALVLKPGSGAVETAAVPLGENVLARFRLSEPVPETGSAAALLPQEERPSATPPYPSTEYRILAAYKLWGVIHYFYAYSDLLDQDWDKTFADYLPKFIAAKDAREYHLTVAEMVSYLFDSQAAVQSSELAQYFGEAPVGLRVRLVTKKPVVTEILDEEAKKAGVKVGDIILKVDGESMGERIKREVNYISASTPQGLSYSVMQRILNGPESSPAVLTIAGADEQPREVKLLRSTRYCDALSRQRTGDVVKILRGNIGYADLDRLSPADVDAMFDKLRNTRTIIFDMRGEPHGTAGAIAGRLTEKRGVQAAIVTGPLVMQPNLPKPGTETSTASYFETQTIPNSEGPKYTHKTVMLIDERTMGEAEHAGLFFETANRTEFIGTPSAGADGDPSDFVLPGGITVKFSGHDVRHVNAGALQRLGLQPTVTVAPTVRGVRAGRDEVLEGALEYLSK